MRHGHRQHVGREEDKSKGRATYMARKLFRMPTRSWFTAVGKRRKGCWRRTGLRTSLVRTGFFAAALHRDDESTRGMGVAGPAVWVSEGSGVETEVVDAEPSSPGRSATARREFKRMDAPDGPQFSLFLLLGSSAGCPQYMQTGG